MNIIKVPVWFVNNKSFFLGSNRYLAYAVGAYGLNIFKNVDDYEDEELEHSKTGYRYIGKEKFLREVETEVKNKLDLLVKDSYKIAYKNKRNELFSDNAYLYPIKNREEQWDILKGDLLTYDYLSEFIGKKFSNKELTFWLLGTKVEGSFIEIDVTDYEKEYSEYVEAQMSLSINSKREQK